VFSGSYESGVEVREAIPAYNPKQGEEFSDCEFRIADWDCGFKAELVDQQKFKLKDARALSLTETINIIWV